MGLANKILLTATFIVAIVTSRPFPADAGETVAPAGPIGGTDINQALLPPSGVYGVGVAVETIFPKYFVNSGSTVDSSGDNPILGGGLLFVYNLHPFGGTLASSIFGSGGRICFHIKGVPNQCSSGLRDSYSDLLMWNRYFPSVYAEKQAEKDGRHIPYGLAVLAGIGLQIPTGAYTSTQRVNAGANFWDIAPNAAVTYTMPSLFGGRLGEATQFSIRGWVNNYTRNPATHYSTGDLVDFDAAITEISGPWQYGLALTAYSQFQPDSVRGVNVGNGGNRANDIAPGPVISYNFLLHNHPFNVAFKGLISVAGTNNIDADLFVIRFSTKL